MQDTIKAGTMLIQEGTLLLTGVPVESDAFLPGWRAVKNLDGHGLGRKIDEADWNFFCLAGEIKATVVGREGVEGLRRAVKQILATRTGQKFNWLAQAVKLERQGEPQREARRQKERTDDLEATRQENQKSFRP